MRLNELKREICEYQYFEDTNIIDVSLSSIIVTKLKIGDPIWLVIIGASSGGKSQILRPLSLTDPKFMPRIDDLTENTFLSGAKVGKGEDPSLLTRIGSKGMLVMSDLTVLFSKSSETRATILSQFRMIYDGEMIKFVGTQAEPIKWNGYLGIIAGSTPSIYSHFEEVADMGERFVYYRMKDYDPAKATRLAMSRKLFGKELDAKLADMYAEYIKDVVKYSDGKVVELTEKTRDRILSIAVFAERVRTPAHTDFKERTIDRIPVPAYPMRVSLQLTAIAKGLTLMRRYELNDDTYELTSQDLDIIDHIGYSLANEEKRAILRVLAHIEYDEMIKTQGVADKIGLSTNITKYILQNMASVGILKRSGDESSLKWCIKNKEDWEIIRRIEGIKDIEEVEDRFMSMEEDEDSAKDEILNNYGKTF